MSFLWAFAVGGAICAVCQILLDKTKITPALLLTSLVILGAFLGWVGVYEPFAKFAGAGATVPLLGFGYALAEGAEEAVAKEGLLGVLKGGLVGTGAGIAAAIFFGWAVALFAKSKTK